MKRVEVIFQMREGAVPTQCIEHQREQEPSQVDVCDFRTFQGKDKTKEQEENPQEMNDKGCVNEKGHHGKALRQARKHRPSIS